MVKLRARAGGAAGTALGLLILGFSSAVFGAMVIGPTLGKAAHARAPEPDPAARDVLDTAERLDRERTVAAVEDEEPPAVSVRPDPFTLPDSAAEPSELPREPDSAVAEPPLPPLHPAEPTEKKPEPTPAARPARSAEAPPKTTPGPAADLARRLTPERAPARAERSEMPRTTEPPAPTPPRETPRAAPSRPEAPLRPPAEPAATPAPSVPTPAAGPAAEPAPAGLFRVRVGAYKNQAEAEAARREANRTPGTAATIYRVGDTYRVQVGAFRKKENADRIAEQLRARNLPVEVTSE